MSLKELLQQWRAVCIALLGIVGTLTLTIGTWIFNWHTVVAAVPPLTGGLVAALLMTTGLKTQGINYLIALPVSMFVFHSLVGYPLTSWLLKKEGKRLINEFNSLPASQKNSVAKLSNDDDLQSKHSFHLPQQYRTSSFILVKVALVALLSNLVAKAIHLFININVTCLVFGVIAHQLGFLESHALNKAGFYDWLIYGLLAYIFSQLSITTPRQMGTIVVQIIVLIALGLLGIFIASSLLAKPFKMTWQMAYACSLTCLFGFPTDYILTSEVSREMAHNKEKKLFIGTHDAQNVSRRLCYCFYCLNYYCIHFS